MNIQTQPKTIWSEPSYRFYIYNELSEKEITKEAILKFSTEDLVGTVLEQEPSAVFVRNEYVLNSYKIGFKVGAGLLKTVTFHSLYENIIVNVETDVKDVNDFMRGFGEGVMFLRLINSVRAEG